MARIIPCCAITICLMILTLAVSGISGGAEDQFFDSDGLTIRYIDVGPRQAEPILLVHGAAQDIESAWGETGAIAALDDEYRVIAMDCRGHGRSDKPHDADAYGVEMANDVLRLLDHLDLDRAHLVGYSMGGRIVGKVLADHPERVISALPCGTVLEPMTPEGVAGLDRLASSIEETDSLRPAIEPFLVDGSMTEEHVDQLDREARAGNDMKAISAVIRGLGGLAIDRARLEANAVPSLSVVGETDPNLGVTRITATYMANLDIEVIEDASHLTAFSRTEFVEAIKAFVGEHAAGDDRFFDSDGVSIRYIDVGLRDGEPIVLIHGFTQRIETAWGDTGVIDALDDEFRVIALDVRGHGKSDTPHDPALYGAKEATDVIRLLDHLNLDTAHIAGYSMGGRITFKLIADHPERIRSALPCGISTQRASGVFAEVLQRTEASLEASGSIQPLIEYLATPGSLSEEVMDGIVDALRASNDTDALLAHMRGWRGLDTDPAKLAANRVPCLALIGENDPLRANLDVTAAAMPHLQVEVIEGTDHLTCAAHPAFVAAIKGFVREHSPDDE